LIQTGSDNYSEFQDRTDSLPSEKVSLVEYIEDMGKAYRMSDLVICRGGAGTMAELIATLKPAIVVPWGGAAENHQYYNGKYLEEKGAAFLVEEDKWLDYPLFELLNDLVSSEEKLRDMSRSYRNLDGNGGTRDVVKTLKDTISEGELC
jgi:UDP-N-acetylglucosamine--N-acetylmuramyl-(pentapeptide) pyrophosphoryl-undecaprenol N-acetylglucosamine transferase